MITELLFLITIEAAQQTVPSSTLQPSRWDRKLMRISRLPAWHNEDPEDNLVFGVAIPLESDDL